MEGKVGVMKVIKERKRVIERERHTMSERGRER